MVKHLSFFFFKKKDPIQYIVTHLNMLFIKFSGKKHTNLILITLYTAYFYCYHKAYHNAKLSITWW